MSSVSNDALRIFSELLPFGSQVGKVEDAEAAAVQAGEFDPEAAERAVERLDTLQPVDDADRQTIARLRALLVPASTAAVGGLPPEPAPAGVADADDDEEYVDDDAAPDDEDGGIMRCLRCDTVMESWGDELFRMSGDADREFEVIVCRSCGKVELFLPRDAI